MAENRFYPVVIVPGIGQSKVVEKDAAGNTLRRVWPLDIDKNQLIDRMKAPFMKMVLFRRDAGFSDAAAETAHEMIGGLATMPNGDMARNLEAVTYMYPLSECTDDEKRYIYKMAPVQKLGSLIGEENIFFFAFNSFTRPYAVAKELRAFVDMVKRRTGSDKVNFLPLSLGGAMFTAYLDEYGSDDVHRIVYFVPALQGTVTVADVFEKNVDPSKADELLGSLIGGSNASAAKSVMGMMPAGVIPALTDKLLDVLIRDVLSGSGAMWACLPPQRYEALAAKYLSDAAHAPLKAETDRYRAAQGSLRETLQALSEKGIGVYICCCYGRSLPGVLRSAPQFSSDGVIDIGSASLGATAAAPGQKLDPSSLGENARLSPDGTLDASTGAFPDSTWYFRDQYHDSIAYNDTALQVAMRALSDESFTGVGSDPALGQFNEKEDNRG